LCFLRASLRGSQVFAIQAGSALVTIGAALWLWKPTWLALVVPIACLPKAYLAQLAAARVTKIEAQIEPWLTALANALKASPSLGEAISSTPSLMASPISEELDVLVKECELGAPLDAALNSFANRINSMTLSTAITALKIARRSGGNLTEMLETLAASLREMARLEGVVRTKTAEGKAQTMVIGVLPLPLVLGVNAIDSQFFDPLVHSFLGHLIIAGAAALWATALIATRKILAVDL
jgi:tight adherence protein B